MNINKTAILILAAGGSSRLGKPKQLLPIGQTTLLNHIIGIAKNSGIDAIFTVLGAYFDQVADSIHDSITDIIKNEQWQHGISTSIVCGIHHIQRMVPNIDQIILLLGDQPLLKSDDIHHLIENQVATNADIVFTDYGENFGPPIIFTKKTFPSLLQIKGDEGAKKVIKNGSFSISFIHINGIETDIDTIEDYNEINKMIT